MSGGDGGRGEERESEREVRSVSVSQTWWASKRKCAVSFLNDCFFFTRSVSIELFPDFFNLTFCAISTVQYNQQSMKTTLLCLKAQLWTSSIADLMSFSAADVSLCFPSRSNRYGIMTRPSCFGHSLPLDFFFGVSFWIRKKCYNICRKLYLIFEHVYTNTRF